MNIYTFVEITLPPKKMKTTTIRVICSPIVDFLNESDKVLKKKIPEAYNTLHLIHGSYIHHVKHYHYLTRDNYLCLYGN